MSTTESSHTGAWARASMYGGVSSLPVWTIDDSARNTRLSVGSDPACDWTVTAPGVAPLHFELFWDGEALWVGSAVGVVLDGRPVFEWTQIHGRGRVDFGGAMLDVEVGSGDAGHGSVIHSAPLQTEATVIVTDLARFAPPVQVHGASTLATPQLQVHGVTQQLGARARGETDEGAYAARTPAPDLFSRPPREGTKGAKTSLPPRTWALLGAVAVALTTILLMGDEAPAAKAESRDRTAATVGKDAVTAAAGATPAVTMRSSDESATAENDDENAGEADRDQNPASVGDADTDRDRKNLERETSDATAADSAAEGVAGETDGGRVTEAQAAALLTEGRYPEAMAAYDELATLDPENQVYPTVRSILARRMARNCTQGDSRCAK